MNRLRAVLCLTLLLGTVLPGFSRDAHRTQTLIPLAKRGLLTVDLSGRVPYNPFDENPNVRVNSDNSGQVQNEEQACISPNIPDVMVAVWRDFRLGYRRVGVGYSHDNGVTWHDGLFPQSYYPWQSDPLLVVDNDGNFTAMVVTFDPAQTGEDGLLQVTSYDGGMTWTDSVFAADSTQPLGFEDKPMFTLDVVPGSPYEGTYYVSWTHFYGLSPYDSTHTWLVYKRPGQPYTDEHVLSQTNSVQWSNVCVGEEGQVYVSWSSYAYGALMFSKSLDGGQTWTAEHQLWATNFNEMNIVPQLLVFAYGAMACDVTNGPHRGRLYMVYTDNDNQFNDADVWLKYSDDHGQTWTPRHRMDDAPLNRAIDQFHPWISVDDSGRVWVTFYDRRNDPNNLLMDLYFTVSEDGGQTWRANERITTVSSDPGAGTLDGGLIGEYIGWQARDNKALAVWTDTRNGNQDVYSSVIDSVFEVNAAQQPRPSLPEQMTLSAYPNPTNGSTTISYSLVAVANVQLNLYDVTGRLARALDLGVQHPGAQTALLNLDDLASGIYIAELNAGVSIARTKLFLLK